MCGIFCITLQSKHGLPAAALTSLTQRALLITERRGRDASGVCVHKKGKTSYVKQPSSVSKLLQAEDFGSIAAEIEQEQDSALTVIGHARLVTNGMRAFHENNQPFDANGLVGIHNGIIVNLDALYESDVPDLDSLAIPLRLRHHLESGLDDGAANEATLLDLQGVVSYLMIDVQTGRVHAASNNGSLYEARLMKAELEIGRLLMSEREMLHLMESDLNAVGVELGRIRRYDPGTVDSWSTDAEPATRVGAVGAEPARNANDLSQHGTARQTELTRCTRCLLPHTMPFIEFDANGVCNWCSNDLLTPLASKATLDRKLQSVRAVSDRPNCLIAVSGGRDSCYGLHLAKNELGLNPIAFTYDWGMVTDLARRNTSRICAKLGIEHIIVSADLNQKRENIRLNIEAWLKRPELGMVPIFTAGDKQFYQHANRLQKELGVPAIIFCENGRYEKTWFKAGFAGINEGNRRLWNLSLVEKLRYVSFYLGQFIRNPAYLNRSVLDSASAFLSSYFLKHDYIQLFDYLPWDEAEVERVLIDEYDFEIPQGCPTTWRVGDGSAPFYNLIYHTAAGFTEFDTFRSNQIRDGKIDREFGLERIAVENIPRLDEVRNYLATVGVSFDKAMTQIMAMPRRF